MSDKTTSIEYEPVRPIPSLNLPELKELDCVRPINSTDSLLFYCEPVNRYTGNCPKCNKPRNHYAHGYALDRLVHDVSIGLVHVDILLRTPRYKCRDCNATFVHPFTSVVEGQQFTRRLYDQIKVRALHGTFADVSKDYGVTIPTVASILVEYSKELEKKRRVIAPRVLGIDEVHIVREKRGVLTDIENGVLLDMTEDNSVLTMKEAIERLFMYSARIECVTIDMWSQYVHVIKECIPHATIVIDRFHVVQNIYKKTEQSRKLLFAHLKSEVSKLPDTDETKERKVGLLTQLGKNVFLFKFGGEKLNEKQERANLMAELCEVFPELNTLRNIKEGAERIYLAEDREDAEQRFEDWKKLIPPEPTEFYAPIHTLRRSMERWSPYIFTYFEERYQFTNAATEGLNSLIKNLNHSGRGYKFETLRIKCLYHTSAADKPRYEWRKSNLHSFSKPKQPAVGMMKELPLFGGNDILDNLYSKEQVSGGGVVISELLKTIKDTF